MAKWIYCSVALLILVVESLSASLPLNHQAVEDRLDSKTALIDMGKAWLIQQARATTTSEVLTLNLTNLIILVVIKAIIFGFGFVGTGRSTVTSLTPIDQSDMLMMLSYALSSSTQDYDCLYRVACEDTEKAHQYMTASKMLLKSAKVFNKFIGYNPKYENVVYGIQEAIEFKNNGGQCSQQYVCKALH